MMRFIYYARFLVAVMFAYMPLLLVAQESYFFPSDKDFDANVQAPSQFLGYPFGTHHTRHDRLVAYFQTLAQQSDKATFYEIGQTYEYRPQVILAISSPKNIARMSEIKQKQQQLADPRQPMPDMSDMPVVVLLGHNVHGNEPSGGEAAILMAYFLTASKSEQVAQMLEKMVVLIDPVYNPDGRDRHTHWANMHKGNPLVSDPVDREHNEVWPGGRTNHYWFDLNRDWFLAVHPESNARLRHYHEWMPNVATDFHEMGTSSTHFFEPAKPSSNNPLVPEATYIFNDRFATHFTKALDKIGSFYFSKEVFDGLYPGYGSSYPDLHGALGLLFEQASSRGHLQQTTSGKPISFAFTIRNQFTSSLATLEASLAERENLLKYLRQFFQEALDKGKKDPIKGFIFGDQFDQTRNLAFVDLLIKHKIEVMPVEQDILVKGRKFEKGKAWAVLTNQTQYRMVRSVFDKLLTFNDSVFYDASTWNLPMAFGLPYAELGNLSPALGKVLTAVPEKSGNISGTGDYAYLMEWTDYAAFGALQKIHEAKIRVKVATQPFVLNGRSYRAGTILIPVQNQDMQAEALKNTLRQIVEVSKVEMIALATGFSQTGPDLGSGSFEDVDAIKPLMLIGAGVSGYEAGEVWHLLDTRLGMPISKVDVGQFSRIRWTDYHVLVMVGGVYNLDANQVAAIKRWVSQGGTLITLKTASEWAIKNGMVSEKLYNMGDSTGGDVRLPYGKAAEMEGAKELGGAIFQASLDLTHPLSYGFTETEIPVYKNGKTMFSPSKNPYNNVAMYTDKPLLSGYISAKNLVSMPQKANLLASSVGAGRVILFADNPNFRGTWWGTNRLFVNALFFGQIVQSPALGRSEE